MSLRYEYDCDCPFPADEEARGVAAVVGWICPDCFAKYKPEGDGDWRCLFGGTPGAEWSGRIADLSDAALLALADAVRREQARRDASPPAEKGCGDPGCTFHNPTCDLHREQHQRALARGMPPSGRHG